MAARLSPAERHFFVFVENGCASVWKIPPARFGTLREILALRQWLSKHPEIATVSVVSSGFHLTRVHMCCCSLLPNRVRVALLGTSGALKWWEDARLSSYVFAEFVKIPFYALALPLVRLRMIKE
jgi:hypothetical protein